MASPPLLVDLFLARISPLERRNAIRDLVERLSSSAREAVDLASLEICIHLVRLCPDGPALEKLSQIVIQDIELADGSPERLRKIVETCLNNADLDNSILLHIENALTRIIRLFMHSEEPELDVRTERFLNRYMLGLTISDDEHISQEDAKCSSRAAVKYIQFMKCYFWLLSERHHSISINLVTSLLALLGCGNLATPSFDALSALMPLLGGEGLRFDRPGAQVLLSERIWQRICDLLHHPSRFESAGPIFKLWFQWLYQGGSYGPLQKNLADDRYWSLLQAGLLFGFSEQRKFCLGILRQSLSIVKNDLSTEHMVLCCNQRHSYEMAYERYCTLFETIVLDRYPNQVQACVGDLSISLSSNSLTRMSWMTTMLSAALADKIQDGVRKIVGNWYMDFVIESTGSLNGHQGFFIEGFLPWATQGFLFTQTFSNSRIQRACAHGNKLSRVVKRIIKSFPTAIEKRKFLGQILNYLLDTRGNLFAYSILYLFEGLIQGLKETNSLISLEASDLELIVKASWRAGMPEIARDLCTTYCMAFFEQISSEICFSVPGYNDLDTRWRALVSEKTRVKWDSPEELIKISDEANTANLPTLQAFNNDLQKTKYKIIQGEGLVKACDYVLETLGSANASDIRLDILLRTFEALWDEADTQEYPKAAMVKLPAILFHQACIQACITHQNDFGSDVESMVAFLTEALGKLQRVSEGRTFGLPPLTRAIRKACIVHPEIFSILPIEEFLLRFVNHPPLPRVEFLFEVAAAEQLQTYIPHRTYSSYYGRREWYSYACIVDLLNRLPQDVAKRLLDRLLHPWQTQKAPIPIISKWKQVFQLQAMLVLIEPCIIKQEDSDVRGYLKLFMDIVALEPWPRYRYLLEWTIARIYLHNPDYRAIILDDLAGERDSNPKLIASLIELAVMVASFPDTRQEFTLRLMTLLIPCSASPRIQIRHEAHRSFPPVWDTAVARGWTKLTENPAFAALNSHIRSLDRYNDPEYGLRMQKLDSFKYHTLVNIFQGDYMHTEPPERELVASEDFEELWAEDQRTNCVPPPGRIPLGTPKPSKPQRQIQLPVAAIPAAPASVSIPLQTKSSSWQSSLLTQTSSPSTKRSTSLILIGSLIDNPYNLGGLSRVSEIFGLEALGIRTLDTLSHKDFLSVSVNSHKHLPIFALPPAEIPEWLRGKQKEGYQVVCVEQTDRSLVLGEGKVGEEVLPEKCVLVLGSEKEGVTAEVLGCADRCVEIRQVGVTRSLNVQTAGAIACFEWQRVWGRRK